MPLLAKPPLGPDTEAIAHQQHPDEEFRVDRRPPGMAVEIGEVAADPGQVHEPVDGAQKVVLRKMILQRELVKQRPLRFLPQSYHRRSPHPLQELNQPKSTQSSASFSTK